ncbi:hypothetical protein PJ311_00325 [Bacillus sp. CLL-7-23]|uniref:Phage protein n=1 Tax=Bacillus changyiensis TaxID=3004103 RepID=A0ABT4WYD6_9BACI|nr:MULTISPECIES: hypothetical protein [Bacillus]MDA7025053.1 hypothetical protein [Bacillus changyiensis]NPC94791.1 hypothetical protein [Bacillus sp. WMMC1349]NPC94839.1 hypothetical protein [Bacillus sp. WMMC1349]
MIKAILKDYSQAKVDDEGNIMKVPEKTYIKAVVTSRQMYRALEIHAIAEETEMNEFDQMKELLYFVVDLFDNQFTFDDILDGVLSEDLLDWTRDITEQVMIGHKKKESLKKKALEAQK